MRDFDYEWLRPTGYDSGSYAALLDARNCGVLVLKKTLFSQVVEAQVEVSV